MAKLCAWVTEDTCRFFATKRKTGQIYREPKGKYLEPFIKLPFGLY